MEETIIALASAPGVGAISVIRLSGEQAIHITNNCFKGKDLTIQKSHSAHFGYIVDGSRELDEVLVTIFKTPNSYTKENAVEISCHGSPYIVQSIIKLFLKNGVRMAEQGEFTKRAFLNGRFDLTQAEAVADLIASESKAGHELALKQLKGGVSSEIKELRTQLIHFASLIELELDFSEEDVEFADRTQLVELIQNIQRYLNKLIYSFEYGNAIKNGVPVAIVGKPNAGKSTLLNALLNENRAIVSDIAGTTRDTIEEVLNVDGVQFRFVDTAGLRETQDEIEKIGVEKALEQIEKSSIFIYLFDINEISFQQVKNEMNLLNTTIPFLIVANKTDLMSTKQFQEYNTQSNLECIFISAKQKSGVEEIKKALLRAIHTSAIENFDVVITNSRHYEMLVNTQEALKDVLNGIDLQITGDFLAVDIRRALESLGRITGDISTDDLLDNIFSKFCIGK